MEASPTIGDINEDGFAEVVVQHGFYSAVYAIKGTNGQTLWGLNFAGYSDLGNYIVLADIDTSSSGLEVIAADGYKAVAASSILLLRSPERR